MKKIFLGILIFFSFFLTSSAFDDYINYDVFYLHSIGRNNNVLYKKNLGNIDISDNGEIVVSKSVDGFSIEYFRISPDSKYIIFKIHGDNTYYMSNINNINLNNPLNINVHFLGEFEFSKDGTKLFYQSSEPYSPIIQSDIDYINLSINNIRKITYQENFFSNFVVSSDNNYIYTFFQNDNTKLLKISTETGQVIDFLVTPTPMSNNSLRFNYYNNTLFYYWDILYEIDLDNFSYINSINIRVGSLYSFYQNDIIYSNLNTSKQNLYTYINGVEKPFNEITSFFPQIVSISKTPLYCELVRLGKEEIFPGLSRGLSHNYSYDYNIEYADKTLMKFSKIDDSFTLLFKIDKTFDLKYYNGSNNEVTSDLDIIETFFDSNSYFKFNNFTLVNTTDILLSTGLKEFNGFQIIGYDFDYNLKYVNSNGDYTNLGNFKTNEYVDFIKNGKLVNVSTILVTPLNGYEFGGYKILDFNFRFSEQKVLQREVCYYENGKIEVDKGDTNYDDLLKESEDVNKNDINSSLDEKTQYCNNLGFFDKIFDFGCIINSIALYLNNSDFLKQYLNIFTNFIELFNFDFEKINLISVNLPFGENGAGKDFIMNFKFDDVSGHLVIPDSIISNYVESNEKEYFDFYYYLVYILFLIIFFLGVTVFPFSVFGIGYLIYQFINNKILDKITLGIFKENKTISLIGLLFNGFIISFIGFLFIYIITPIFDNILQIFVIFKNIFGSFLLFFYSLFTFGNGIDFYEQILFFSDKLYLFIAGGIIAFILSKIKLF